MACAYYLAEKGYPVTVFDRNPVPGGMLMLGIPSFRLEKEVVNAEIEILTEMGVEFRCGVEVGKDVTIAQLREQGYRGFYVAIGAQKSAAIRCPGETLTGVLGGVDFLRSVNLGEQPDIGKAVAVIGGGNVSIDVARAALRLGAEKVYLVYRRGESELKADRDKIEDALAEGMELKLLRAPSEIVGKNGKVSAIRLEIMELGEPDASGRRSPLATGEFFEIPCDLVISAVGEKVDAKLMADNGIEMERKGPAFKTNVENVWCAGDAHRGPATVVEGIADAASFAEAVIGEAHTYDIPEAAYPSKAQAIAKKGILKMAKDACCEGSRCLDCNTVCENCADSCPNRANVVIKLSDGRHQILHIDKMCNECGNCTQFCPYASEPCRDKFTLFQTKEDMEDSRNAGVLFLGGDKVLVRMAEVKEYDLSQPNELPKEIENLILTVRSKYAYLFN